MTEPNACIATNCHYIGAELERCERERCPFAWQRRGSEDRKARDARDAKEKRGMSDEA